MGCLSFSHLLWRYPPIKSTDWRERLGWRSCTTEYQKRAYKSFKILCIKHFFMRTFVVRLTFIDFLSSFSIIRRGSYSRKLSQPIARYYANRPLPKSHYVCFKGARRFRHDTEIFARRQEKVFNIRGRGGKLRSFRNRVRLFGSIRGAFRNVSPVIRTITSISF